MTFLTVLPLTRYGWGRFSPVVSVILKPSTGRSASSVWDQSTIIDLAPRAIALAKPGVLGEFSAPTSGNRGNKR